MWLPSFNALSTDRQRVAEAFAFAGTSLFFFVLLLVKAWWVPPTQDEVTSFFEFGIGNWKHVFSTESSNNHFLNTILGRLAMWVGGQNMFSFRLPNVFSFLLLCFGLWRIGDRLPFGARWGLFLCMFLCYPLFEYFALARGYGMSFALLVLEIELLLRYTENPGLKQLSLLSLVTALSVFAHLNLLNQSILVFVIIALIMVFHRIKGRWSLLVLALLLATLVLNAMIGFSYSSIIKHYFADDSGFFTATIGSLFNMHRDYTSDTRDLIAVFFPFLVGVLLVVASFVQSRAVDRLSSPQVVLLFLLAANVIACQLLSLLFHIHFPTERVALYFIPFFFISTAFALSAPVKPPFLKKAFPWLMWILVFHLAGDFYTSWDPQRSGVEPYAHVPESEFLAFMKASGDECIPVIAGDERKGFAWRYYAFKHKARLNNWLNAPLPNSHGELTRVPAGDSCFTPNVREKENDKGDFIGVYYQSKFHSADSVPVQLDFQMHAKRPGRFVLYASLKHLDKEEIYYQPSAMDQLLVTKDAKVSGSWMLPDCDTCILSIFIHNMDRIPVTVLQVQSDAL